MPPSASGSSDPFLKLMVGTHERKSSTIKGTLDPRWYEDIAFIGEYGELTAQPMVLDVCDASGGYMGEGRVDLGALMETLQGTLCAVALSDGQVKPGQVLLAAWWEPDPVATAARDAARKVEVDKQEADAATKVQAVSRGKRARSGAQSARLDGGTAASTSKELDAFAESEVSAGIERALKAVVLEKAIADTMVAELTEAALADFVKAATELVAAEVLAAPQPPPAEKLPPPGAAEPTVPAAPKPPAAQQSVLAASRPQAAYEQGRRMNQTGTLRVRLSRATGLLTKGGGGTCAPYARVVVGSMEFASRLVRETRSPSWGDDFEFRGRLRALLSTPLCVSCWAWDFVKDDDPLGQGACDLAPHAAALSEGLRPVQLE
eukprot:3039851-Prymnesium_polylepis.1